jgi:hypothetical protein
MATYYFRNTGDVNWGTATNWSLTDGGGATGSVPTSADDVFFTINSGDCNVNTSSRSARNIDFTGYINTITLSVDLFFYGNITLGASMGIGTTGSGELRSTTNNATLTSNGKVWTYGIRFFGNSTTVYTLTDNWTITGNITFNAGTLNGNTLYVGGNLTLNSGSIMSGTTLLYFNSTTIFTNLGANILRLSMTFNTTGIVTLSSIPYSGGGTITYIPNTGSVITTGTTLSVTTGGATLNTSGMTWDNISTLGSSTSLTLLSDLNIDGNFIAGASTATINGLYNVNIKGNITFNNVLSGTATLILNGAGNQTWSHSTSNYLSNNLIINKPSGTLTLGANVYYSTGTLTINSGDIDDITNNSVLNLLGTTTKLDTQKFIWNNVNAGSGIYTFISNFYCNNYTGGGGSVSNNNSGGDMYLYKSLTHGSGGMLGTATIYFAGGVTWRETSNNSVRNNIVIDTSETVTFDTLVNYSIGTLNYKRGKVNAKNCNFIISVDATLINCHKINFDLVTITSGIIVTMNEFFNGSPNLKTRIQASSTTNYTISFQDNFEKISKFVNVSRCTLSRPQQLLVITDSKKSSTNTRGMRYINNLPNGISKDNPSTSTQTTYSTNMLVGDPSMISNI